MATTGNDSTGDGSSGNPYASPGKAAAVATTSGDIIYVKSGTYTLTTSTPGAAGPVVLSKGVRMEGYQTVIGDLGTAPVINAGAIGTITMMSIGGDNGGSASATVLNVECNGNSQAAVIGFDLSAASNLTGGETYLCLARNCVTGFANPRLAVYAYAVDCTTGFSLARSLYACGARGGTTGFTTTLNSGSTIRGCGAAGQSGKGFSFGYEWQAAGNFAYSCGGNGFDASLDSALPLNAYLNNVAYLNGAYGFQNHSSGQGLFVGNATGGPNTSGAFSTAPLRHVGAITLSADPFANAAGYTSAATLADFFACFAPNATAGGGALLRAAGFPPYADVGAVQHLDSGGAAGMLFIPSLDGV